MSKKLLTESQIHRLILMGGRLLWRRPLVGLLTIIVAVGIYYIQLRVIGQEPVSAPPKIFIAQVAYVVDGDTVQMETSDGQELRIRLYGIDAPEMSQDYGADSSRHLTALIGEGQWVSLKTIDVDRYDRQVSLIYLPSGELVNREMIARGQAWVYIDYCHIPECELWQVDQRAARERRLGLWQASTPEPPWEYRRR